MNKILLVKTNNDRVDVVYKNKSILSIRYIRIKGEDIISPFIDSFSFIDFLRLKNDLLYGNIEQASKNIFIRKKKLSLSIGINYFEIYLEEKLIINFSDNGIKLLF